MGPQLERNRLLEEVAAAAIAHRQGDREAERRLDVALGRLHRAPNPGRSWLQLRCDSPARAGPALRPVREGRDIFSPLPATLLVH